ncbi:MAG: flagellar biosynthetic protein FliO [Deltaproteobacteria bacterium]|nr:flagellar biosynthetic protein FliO [Deltaproteobacteria bacterium]
MTGSYAYLFVKAVLTLVFVLGLMGISLYALKRYMNMGSSKGNNGKPKAPIKVLSTSVLGQKKNIAIVDVAGEVIVLGLTPTTISFLTKIENTETIEELRKHGPGRAGLFNLFQGGL